MSSARERLKAKLAAKQNPAAAVEQGTQPEVAAPVEPKPKPAPKKAVGKNAAVIARLQKQKEEDEKRRKWEAEQKLIAEEEEKAAQLKAEEDARIAAELAEAKRIEREKLKKEGKILTKKQKEDQERAARMREVLMAQGLFPTEAILANAEEKNKKQGNKQPVKTKIQLEAERVRAEQERREIERKKIHADAFEKVKEEHGDLYNSWETLKETINSHEVEISDLNEMLSKLNIEKDNLDGANEEEEEELDDWDASDSEDDDVKTELIAKITKVTADINDKTNQLNSVKEEYGNLDQQVMELQKKNEAEILKQNELAKKEAEIAAKEAELLALEKSENKHANSNLRSPIVVILGHVDSGKTSLLDRIRGSSVARGEAGGITQQIGATFVPGDSIREMCSKLPEEKQIISKLKLPGLLCIDTPGHESFSMLRSRGSDICDLAILVVDIQKGLQQQTLESIELLRARKTPFVVAITKVDAIYQWNKSEDNFFNPIETSLEKADDLVKHEFDKLMNHAIAAFAEQRLNALPFWQNKDSSKFVNLMPLSSKSGEGIPDLLNMVCDLTQSRMDKRLQKSTGFQCTILEVKHLDGYGTTLDVILINGTIREGDTIVCAGLAGPVVTQVRSLLTPPPNRDQRVKVEYQIQKSVHAAMGFKIAAPGLHDVLAGSSLLVCGPRDNLDDLMDEAQEDLQAIISRLDVENNGVFVHASSLGSLEALLTFLRDENIPIAGFDIGSVHKASITKASIQLDKKKPEYAVLLAFDVKVDADAQALADRLGVKIFAKDVIYHLNDLCVKHFKQVRDNQKLTAKPVFPVVVKSLGKNMVFHNTDPVIMGVKVIAGSLRVGTPLFIPRDGNLQLGRVVGIKKDNIDTEIAKKNDEVSISIDQKELSHPPVFGRQFDDTHEYVSFMNRTNVDTIREYYAEDLTDTDNKLMDKFIELKWIN